MQIITTNNGNEVNDKVPETSNEVSKDNVFGDIDASTDIHPNESTKKAEESSSLPGVTSGSSNSKGKINYEEYSKDDLVITPEEKSKFIDALVTGGRYVQEFSIFGGRVKVKIRSRTTKETQAMYAYMRHALSQDGGNISLLEGDMVYLLLVAQIDEINGTKFPEMKAPLSYYEDEGTEKEPGWLKDLEAWKSKPEGLTGALVNRVQLFEYKYWTMVREAPNTNFWSSDTSTGESKTVSESH